MTDAQKAYIQALSDVRSYHRWQIGQALGDMRTIQTHESAIAWVDEVIAAKTRHAAEDEAERQRAPPRTPKSASPGSDPSRAGSPTSGRTPRDRHGPPGP
jgi:hypothetical protein